MTFLNEGEWDRGARIFGGLLVFGAGWSFAPGPLAMALIGAGALALITGIAGWCPAYSVFRFSTRKITRAHCPTCEKTH